MAAAVPPTTTTTTDDDEEGRLRIMGENSSSNTNGDGLFGSITSFLRVRRPSTSSEGNSHNAAREHSTVLPSRQPVVPDAEVAIDEEILVEIRRYGERFRLALPFATLLLLYFLYVHARGKTN